MTTIRPFAPRVLGWLGMVAGGLLLVDVVWRGSGREAVVAGLVLVVLMTLLALFTLRPRVVLADAGVLVLNPLREVFVPWSAFTDADVTDVLRVHAGERTFRVWALREGRRRHVRDNLRRAVGDPTAPPNPADPDGPAESRPANQAAERLRTEAARRRDSAGAADGGVEPVMSWSPLPVAVLAAPTVLLLVALLLG